MTDLQDALDKWDKHHTPDDPFMKPFVEAARLVANPNIQAHREAFYALVEDGGMYNPTFIDGLIAAALTPGTTE